MRAPGHTSHAGEATERAWTRVDALAEEYVRRLSELDPVAATAMGVTGHDHEMTDYSPAGHAERSELDRRTLRELEALVAGGALTDAVDTVTADVMAERLRADLALAEAGEGLAVLNVATSPPADLAEILDAMPTDTPEQVDALTARLAATPAALSGMVDSLLEAHRLGVPPMRRQVMGCTTQFRRLGDPEGFFQGIVTRATANAGGHAAVAGLRTAAAAAAAAYAGLAERMTADVLPRAVDADAVGEQRYRLWSRAFLGDDTAEGADLADAYAWAMAQVRRLRAEAEAVSARVVDGGGLAAAVAALNRGPDGVIVGAAAFLDWMQETSDAAIEALDGSQFDIPEPARRLECRISPTATGAVYYTGPSEDFTRPGTMWWSVPVGVDRFATWEQRTTVHHEGVPGHHLQISAAVARAGELNAFRRLASWTSGHGEGWALYAEGLMAELGFMDAPGDRLGLVASQLLRACRVVVDIGVHCGLVPPAETGATSWNAAVAWDYLRANTVETHVTLRYELDRYLGWPGQAASYALGQRTWAALREDARRAAGAAFDPVAWHGEVLALGSMGLGPLRRAVSPG